MIELSPGGPAQTPRDTSEMAGSDEARHMLKA